MEEKATMTREEAEKFFRRDNPAIIEALRRCKKRLIGELAAARLAVTMAQETLADAKQDLVNAEQNLAAFKDG